MRRKASIEKLERLGVLTFRNSIRLHLDSVNLYRLKSYPSAFFLSAMALEEFGKLLLLEDVVFDCYMQPHDAEGQNWRLKAIYSHEIKQVQSFRWLLDHRLTYDPVREDFFVRLEKLHKAIDTRVQKLELTKQKAMYVGLPRKKQEVNVAGRVISPFDITGHQAKRLITEVSDLLRTVTAGQRAQVFGFEIEGVTRRMNAVLLEKLSVAWPNSSPWAVRWCEQMQ